MMADCAVSKSRAPAILMTSCSCDILDRALGDISRILIRRSNVEGCQLVADFRILPPNATVTRPPENGLAAATRRLVASLFHGST